MFRLRTGRHRSNGNAERPGSSTGIGWRLPTLAGLCLIVAACGAPREGEPTVAGAGGDGAQASITDPGSDGGSDGGSGTDTVGIDTDTDTVARDNDSVDNEATSDLDQADTRDTITKDPTAEDPIIHDPTAEDTTAGSGPRCSAESGPEGVNVRWHGLPAENEIGVFGDGELLTTVTSGPEGVLTLFGMSAEEGSGIELTFDHSGRQMTIGCGPANASTEPAQPDTTSEPQNQPADLAEAENRFNQLALGPHAYMTLADGGETMELYMAADGDGNHGFLPPLDQPAFMNPFSIHDELANAMAQGRDVEYRLDPSSGLPTWWTVDGRAMTMLCLQLDTAPPALRTGPCDPAADLIGA